MTVEEELEPQSNVAAKYAKWSIIFSISFYLSLIVLFNLEERVGIDIPYPLSKYIMWGIFVLPCSVGCIFSFIALIKAGAQVSPIKKRYVILFIFSLIHAFGLLMILYMIVLLSNIDIRHMS